MRPKCIKEGTVNEGKNFFEINNMVAKMKNGL